MGKAKENPVPSELEGAAKIRDVNALEARVEKCYSKENHKEFQEDVVDIILTTLGNDEGRKKIKEHSREEVKDYLNNATWERVKFWLPTLIAIAGLLLAIFKP